MQVSRGSSKLVEGTLEESESVSSSRQRQKKRAASSGQQAPGRTAPHHRRRQRTTRDSWWATCSSVGLRMRWSQMRMVAVDASGEELKVGGLVGV